MKKQLTDRLEAMINKTYNYGGRIHCVLSFKEQGGRLILKTNLETYEKSLDAVEDFLSYWDEHGTAGASTNTDPANQAPALQQENDLVTKLTDILMDNITKVQGNPEYIKQAQAINNNVNSIINVTKLKLDVLKASRGRR